MFNLIASITILGALYWGFIRGYIWRALMWIFSVYGMSEALNHIDALKSSPIIILGHPIEWSIVISFIIAALAIITTKINKEAQ